MRNRIQGTVLGIVLCLSLAAATGSPLRSLTTELLELGQSGVTTSGTGTTGTTTPTTIRIVPHIVSGSFGQFTKYSTIIHLINPNSTSVSATVEFFKQDGSSSSIKFKTSDNSATQQGTLSKTIPERGAFIVTANIDTDQTIAWGRVTSAGYLTISTVFEARDAETGNFISRVGVPASASDIRSMVIPRISNPAVFMDGGFAIVNTSSSSATLTATLYGTAGQTLGSRTYTLPARSQTAQFGREFFALSESAGTTYSHAVISSSISSMAAVALSVEGASLTSLPVDRLQ